MPEPIIAVFGGLDEEPIRQQINAKWLLSYPDHREGLRNVAMLQKHGWDFTVIIIYLGSKRPRLSNPQDFVHKVIKESGVKTQIFVVSELEYSRSPFIELGCIPCHTDRVGQILAATL